MKKIILLYLTSIALMGCSSMNKSMLAGTAIGGAMGAAIGNQQGRGDNRNKKTNNGLLIGSAIGLAIGYLAGSEKQKKLGKNSLAQEKVKDDAPLLTMPKIKRVWVDDKISGKRFVKGHWEFIIEENSVWSRK